MADHGQRPAHFVQALERGLAVIRAFDTSTPKVILSDAARATGLTRAAAVPLRDRTGAVIAA